MLNEESKTWWNLNNLGQLEKSIMIPDYIFDQTDYYLRLHEQALLYSDGDFDAMDELSLDNVQKLKTKNKILIPIYQQVISYIKHIKNTKEK